MCKKICAKIGEVDCLEFGVCGSVWRLVFVVMLFGGEWFELLKRRKNFQ